MSAARFWSVVFLLASAGLGVLVARDLTTPPTVPAGPPRSVATTAASVNVERVEPPAPRALEEFSAISERPVFSQSRRPGKPAADRPARGRQPDGLVLMGTVIGRDRKAALLKVPDKPTLQTVAEGEKIGGWTLEAVLPDRIVLTDGGDSVEISIWENHPRSSEAGADVKVRERERERREDEKATAAPHVPGMPEPGRPDIGETEPPTTAPVPPKR